MKHAAQFPTNGWSEARRGHLSGEIIRRKKMDEFIVERQVAVNPGLQSLHVLDDEIGFEGVPGTRRGDGPVMVTGRGGHPHALGCPQQVGKFTQA